MIASAALREFLAPCGVSRPHCPQPDQHRSDIHVVQGNLKAGDTLSLDSANHILLEAGQNRKTGVRVSFSDPMVARRFVNDVSIND